MHINHLKAAVKCLSKISISSSHIAVGLSQLKFFKTFGLTTPNSPTFYPFKMTSNCCPAKKNSFFPGVRI
jgi:hypothetical protein